jgi:hypothetical protein
MLYCIFKLYIKKRIKINSIKLNFSDGSSISITNVKTNDRAKIRFDRKRFFDSKPSNILGWSLAVSDIIDNDIGLVAISCITDEDMNPKGIEKVKNYQIALDIIKQLLHRFVRLFIPKCLVYSFFILVIFLFLPILMSVFLLCFFILLNLYYFITHFISYYFTNKDNAKQFRLSWISSNGIVKLFKFSFNSINDNSSTSIYRHGGIVNFLKSSENNNVILVCMNYIKIQKININLKKNISVFEESSYLLPENLFKKLENIKDAKINLRYLLKSKYQEFLMIDTNDHQKVHNIEIYNINTLQLVNDFCIYHEKDFLISNNDEPGIFAISTDSRLFAYSYGNNIITIYLIESGLEIVSKKFNDIYEIKFLEFIEKDKKLLIIEQGKGSDVKFHIWVISGCLNDYFLIPKGNILLSDNIPTLLNYDEYYYTLTKANGKVVFLNDKDNENPFKILPEIQEKFINMVTFEESDKVIEEHEYIHYSHNIEPWNDKVGSISGKFLNNDKRFLLIIGQNSIQVWKSKSQHFKDFEDFKSFENSDLIYIFISKLPFESKPRFQIKNDMTTIIVHACKSLAYLYNHKNLKSINFKEKHQKFVSGIKNIIKDFIIKCPDNWKLMEVQYPLMAYLIYSRSFSLIKYVLFGTNGQTSSHNGMLHRPQNKYDTYPYYDDLKLYDDFKLKDEDLKSVNDLELALKFCQG